MTTSNQNTQIEGLATLLVLDDETRRLKSLREFGFFTTNETHRMIPYHTAWLWRKGYAGLPELLNQSGSAEIDPTAPLNQWVREKIRSIIKSEKAKELHQSMIAAGPEVENAVPREFADTLPDNYLWCPLFDPTEKINAGLILFREQPFSEQEVKMLRWLLASYQYTWVVLNSRKNFISIPRIHEKKIAVVAVMTIVIGMFYPVHLSVLGSATVVPLDPVLINAPMQGVIKSIAVNPGDQVQVGTLLFSLDKTDLESDEKVSRREYELTQAKLRTAIQESFVEDQNPQAPQSSNSEIPILKSQLDIDEAHIQYTIAMLQKADVRSPIAGIAVFDSKDDWTGQPVQTGERIMVIANNRKVQLKIDLPVTNAIRIEPGAAGEFFMNGRLDAQPIRITSLGYNARMTASHILAYPINAELMDKNTLPQLGAEGTAKIYGKRVPLVYYLFRRPLQTARQKLGI